MSSNSETVPSRFTGRVKWFNNKTGYGFITVTSRDAGEFLNLDVFVHHSAVVVSGQQYKYLVQGEYVEFQLSEMTSGQHKYQVLHVSGIDGGKLMCETRNENQDFREPRETREPREHREPREPREEPADWSRVNRHVSEDRGRGAGRGLGRGAGRGLGRGTGLGRGAGRGLGRGAGRSSSTHADV
jgi:cold shock CspA family protein